MTFLIYGFKFQGRWECALLVSDMPGSFKVRDIWTSGQGKSSDIDIDTLCGKCPDIRLRASQSDLMSTLSQLARLKYWFLSLCDLKLFQPWKTQPDYCLTLRTEQPCGEGNRLGPPWAT